jgi:hypothetical protein
MRSRRRSVSRTEDDWSMSSEDLQWAGPDLVGESQGNAARTLNRLFQQLGDAYNECLDADDCGHLPPAIRAALERMANGYWKLKPLLLDLCNLPPAERLKYGPRYAELIHATTLIEMKLIGELAKARQDWLSRYCRGEQ